jgi:hypothetical protein
MFAQGVRLQLGSTGVWAIGLLSACAGAGDSAPGGDDSRAVCDVPALFASTCAYSTCHNADDKAGSLDLVSTGVGDRVSLHAATTCYGFLADPANPTESVLYTKVSPDNDCGSNMPLGGAPLSAADVDCVAQWVEGLSPPPEDTGEYCALCECEPGSTQACYNGAYGTEDEGICAAGVQTCLYDGTWGTCANAVLPSVEDCHTADVDEDCDGSTPSCSEVWSMAFGNDTDQAIRSVAFDSQGSVYVLGDFTYTIDFGMGPFTSDGENADIVLAKYDEHGTPLWAKYWGDSSNQYATKIIVDGDDNPIIMGRAFGKIDFGGGELDAEGTDDIFVAKLDAEGDHIWSRIFGGVDPDRAERMTTDSENNVIITGTFTGDADFGWGPVSAVGERDAVVIKLDADYGSHVFSVEIGGKGDDYGFGVGVDMDDNIYVSGRFSDSVTLEGETITSAGGLDVYFGKLSPSGDLQWLHSFGSAGDDLAHDLMVHATGPTEQVVLLGHVYDTVDFGGGPRTSAGDRDIYVAAYDTDGVHAWSELFGDPADQFGTSYDTNTWINLRPDESGNIWVGATFTGSIDFGAATLTCSGSTDMLVFGLDQEGDFLTAQKFGDQYTEIVEDFDVLDDFMVLGGRFFSTSSGIDFGAAGSVTGAGSGDGVVAKLPL